jgi:cytoskeletal protein CcmA (bactofilin family)
MFKKDDKKASGVKVSNPNKVGANAIYNIIGAETVIEGSITTESNIRIDGVLRGSLKSKAKIVIGPTGRIEGDVVGQNADIEGEITGKVTVMELLVLKSTSQVEGDIATNKFVVEAGAKFNGNCRMGALIKEIEQDKVFELAAQE